MTVRTKLKKLIEHGAVIKVLAPGVVVPELTLAEVLWYTDPERIRWCAIYPEHQGHVHETEYDEVTIEHNRDVAFYKDGVMVAYVCPYEESGLPDEEVRDALTGWWRLLQLPWNEERLETFMRQAI